MPGVNCCAFPDLPAPYAAGLKEAVTYVLARYPTVVGVIASGTIIRGRPDPSSDLDIYVIHRDGYRQRVQRFFNGVPAEIFVNPPAQVERYLVEEARDRSLITAHMIGTGFVVLDEDPVVGLLRGKARALLASQPEVPENPTYPRYIMASLFEDVLDVRRRDPRTARMILFNAVERMLRHAFTKAGRWTPRTKDLQRELASLDHELGRLAARFYRARTLRGQIGIGCRIADRVIGCRGFFEWESDPEPVE
jgi:hypothetical protein